MNKPHIHIRESVKGHKLVYIAPKADTTEGYYIGVDLAGEMAEAEPKTVVMLVKLLLGIMGRHINRKLYAKRIIVPNSGRVLVTPRIAGAR